VAAQLAASQEGLSSMSEGVLCSEEFSACSTTSLKVYSEEKYALCMVVQNLLTGFQSFTSKWCSEIFHTFWNKINYFHIAFSVMALC
jgi:hypothetical protein